MKARKQGRCFNRMAKGSNINSMFTWNTIKKKFLKKSKTSAKKYLKMRRRSTVVSEKQMFLIRHWWYDLIYLPKDSDVRWQIFDTQNETICPVIRGRTKLTSEPPKNIWYDQESIRNLAYVDMNFGFLRAKSYLLNISSSPPCLLSDKIHKTITQSDHTSTQNTKCTTVFHKKGSCAVGFDLACLEAEEVDDLLSLSTFLVWRNNFRGGASKPYPNRKITCGKQTKKIRICLL